MITLRTLGAVGLTDAEGREVDGLLRQPKRLAILVYLAAPAPGTWHRRDELVGIFWPEFEMTQARTALRNALYVLRQHLGPALLRTRGDDEVSLDPLLLTSDASMLMHHAQQGQVEECLDGYRGDFLPGFFVDDAGEFERWVDEERRRLRQVAIVAATRLSATREHGRDLAGAVTAQRRAVELDPDDESATRRLILLLDLDGDRIGALATFDRLRARMHADFGTEPSKATVRLVEGIRTRPVPALPDLAPPLSPVVELPPAYSGSKGEPVAIVHNTVERAPSWRSGSTILLGLASVIILVTAGMLWKRQRQAPTEVTTLLLLPMENATGQPANDYIATGLVEDVVRRLRVLGSVTIRSAVRADWPAGIRDSLGAVGRAFGATVAVQSRLTMVGDSLQVDATVVDPVTGSSNAAQSQRFVVAALRDVGSELAAVIAGTVFRVPLPELPRGSTSTLDPESYRLTMLGWHLMQAQTDYESARSLFIRATVVDPTNARAWSGLSSTWAAETVNGLVPFDKGYQLATVAAQRALSLDSLQGSAWANLGMMQALQNRSVAAGEPYFHRAIAAEPANAEVFMVYSSVLRFAWSWDQARDPARIARQLDPLSSFYMEREANGAMCEDRPTEALTLYRAQVELNPKDRQAGLGVARSLARLGRWDEAIAQLGILGRYRGDTTLVGLAATQHGEAAYWALKHREGEALLRARELRAQHSWTAPYLIGVSEIGAGHIDEGMTLLESEVAAGSRMVYKLPCNAEIDEVRSTPRFKRLLQAAGALPLGRP